MNTSIRIKIILPYIFLTLAVGIAGAYIVTSLVFDSAEERLDNQLLVAGRLTANAIVDQELARLAALRHIAYTEQLPEALRDNNATSLATLVPPILSNHNHLDSVILLDKTGTEILSIKRTDNSDAYDEPVLAAGASYADWEIVQTVLAGSIDDFGDKYTVLVEDPGSNKQLIYTLGPVTLAGEPVGVVLVGNQLNRQLQTLDARSQAKITFYRSDGSLLGTTYSGEVAALNALLQFDPTFTDLVVNNQDFAQKRQVEISGQSYSQVYAPLWLRDKNIGVYAIGLPSNFVVKTSSTSRNYFVLMVFAGIVLLVLFGTFVAQQIIKPIAKLVNATNAIAAGDLSRQTGVRSEDEIGTLARSFDSMTVDLRQRTDALAAETSRMRAILQSIADGVIVKDEGGDIIQTNPAATEILNFIAEEGRTLQDLAVSNGTGGLNRFQEGERTFSSSQAPVINHDDEALGSVLVLRDITTEVESEQLKNKFIESISHELLTPLVPMKGYLDLLVMTSGDKLDDQQQAFISKIGANLTDLNELISTLIDVTQLEAGSLGLEVDDVELVEIFNEVAATWQPRMADASLNFIVQNDLEAVWLEGDARRLKRVLNALLDNAVTYTHAGGNVALTLSQTEDGATIDVQDSGVGIAPDAQKHIFTRFVRAVHEDFYEERGAGLSLYMAKAIVTEHQGKIWFESTAEQGSTFHVWLPLADE